jgi:hypothetical protein
VADPSVVNAADLNEGDAYHGDFLSQDGSRIIHLTNPDNKALYVVLTAPELVNKFSQGKVVRVRVQYADGSVGEREFPWGTNLCVRRADAPAPLQGR